MTTGPVAKVVSGVSGADTLRPKDLKQAATQFEALMLSELLKSVHEGEGPGWLGTGEDEAGSSMMDMAEEQLSQAMAAQGGLGLARMVVQQLTPKQTKPAAETVSTAPQTLSVR